MWMKSQPHGLDCRAKWFALWPLLSAVLLWFAGCASLAPEMKPSLNNYAIAYDTPLDAASQVKLEAIDADLRGKYGISTQQTAVGVLDLKSLRLAMIHPDRIEYAASVPKIGILLAYFDLHPEATTNLSTQVRHALVQ